MTKQNKKLTIGSFTRKGIPGSFWHYFSYILPDGKEIRLESCMNGYDVAIYDKEGGNLIGEKTCTNMKGGRTSEKAVEIANQKLEELKNEKTK